MFSHVVKALLLISASLRVTASTAPRVVRDNPQTSLTLSPAAITTAWEDDGSSSGSQPSLTSSNNFINWCLTTGLPLMNGTYGNNTEVATCNPVPMGAIPASSNMPSVKFQYPTNFAIIAANTTFTVLLNVRQLTTGFFANTATNWFGAPQQLDDSGFIKGHPHFTIEALESLNQTTPNDPTKYAFYAPVSKAAVDGVVSANVTGGLPAGFYKLSSLVASMNHQPVVLPIPNHGSSDDAVYFTVQ